MCLYSKTKVMVNQEIENFTTGRAFENARAFDCGWPNNRLAFLPIIINIGIQALPVSHLFYGMNRPMVFVLGRSSKTAFAAAATSSSIGGREGILVINILDLCIEISFKLANVAADDVRIHPSTNPTERVSNL